MKYAVFVSLLSKIAADASGADMTVSFPAFMSDVNWRSAESACQTGCVSFYDGCNTCMCGEDGLAICTMRMCITVVDPSNPARCLSWSNGPEAPAPAAVKPLEESVSNSNKKDRVCPENCQSFYDGCNNCSCSRDGTNAACTMMMCHGNYQKNAECKAYFTEESTEAVPAAPVATTKCPSDCKSSYFDGCNTCMCLPDGSAACTRKMCPAGHTGPAHCLDNDDEDAHDKNQVAGEEAYVPQQQAVKAENQACAEGCETYFDGCNTCNCNKDGSMTCTAKFCLVNVDTPRCMSYNINGEHRGNGGIPKESIASTPLSPSDAARQAIEEGEKVDLATLPASPGIYSGVPNIVCPAQCKDWRDGCMECNCASEGVLGDCRRRLVCSEEKRTAAASCSKWTGKVNLRGRN